MSLLKNFQEKLSSLKNSDEAEHLRVQFFGKKGLLTLEMQKLKDLSGEAKKNQGIILNNIKQEMSKLLEAKQAEFLNAERAAAFAKEKLDVSIPGRTRTMGSLHPVTLIIEEVKEIFNTLGFEISDGPEIESAFRNFDALNVSPSHPSRNISDTFYFADGNLLRTHTTSVQIRCLESKKLPILAISYGKVYRPDYDATHTPMFHQIDGMFLTKNGSMANLKGVLNDFVTRMFPNVKTRFRPHFFPFTEPSAELDMSCPSCLGGGCNICKQSGWIEILGCGMVSPEVLKHFGYSLQDVTGFAFGMGVERLVMIKYGIKDIRLLFDNDLRAIGNLKQR